MKLTKDQIQKIALGAMMLCGLTYIYSEFLLSPMESQRAAEVKSAAALDPKIAAAKAQIAKVRALEEKLPGAEQMLAQVEALVPEGAPVAWFPPKVSEIFKANGVPKVTARINNETLDKDFPAFRRLNWAVEAPRTEFVPFAHALAAFENEELLLEVQAFEIEAGREDVGTQRATLNVNNLVRL